MALARTSVDNNLLVLSGLKRDKYLHTYIHSGLCINIIFLTCIWYLPTNGGEKIGIT